MFAGRQIDEDFEKLEMAAEWHVGTSSAASTALSRASPSRGTKAALLPVFSHSLAPASIDKPPVAFGVNG